LQELTHSNDLNILDNMAVLFNLH